jgi:hypothetical protein
VNRESSLSVRNFECIGRRSYKKQSNNLDCGTVINRFVNRKSSNVACYRKDGDGGFLDRSSLHLMGGPALEHTMQRCITA